MYVEELLVEQSGVALEVGLDEVDEIADVAVGDALVTELLATRG